MVSTIFYNLSVLDVLLTQLPADRRLSICRIRPSNPECRRRSVFIVYWPHAKSELRRLVRLGPLRLMAANDFVSGVKVVLVILQSHRQLQLTDDPETSLSPPRWFVMITLYH